MKHTAKHTLATPSPDTVATREITAWAGPGPQRKGRAGDVDRAGTRRQAGLPTHEPDRSAAERELMTAMQEYKRTSGRMFPTWSEVLEVLRGLGYQKQA